MFDLDLQGRTEKLKVGGGARLRRVGANIDKNEIIFVKSLFKCPKRGRGAKDRCPLPLYAYVDFPFRKFKWTCQP